MLHPVQSPKYSRNLINICWINKYPSLIHKASPFPLRELISPSSVFWQHLVHFLNNILIYWHLLYLVKVSVSSCLKGRDWSLFNVHSILCPPQSRTQYQCFLILATYHFRIYQNGLWNWKMHQKIVAGHSGSTLYLDKEGGFNSAKRPRQLHSTLQCTQSHFCPPHAISKKHKTVRPESTGCHADGRLRLKEKKEKTIQAKPRPTTSIKTTLQRLD